MDWLELPELALVRVLNYLPLHDQLNARLVCNHWKLINDSSVRRDELVLFLEIYPRPIYWFHDGSEVNLGNAFLFTSLASLKNEFFMRHFRKVQRFMIAHRQDTPSENFIKQIQIAFPQLKHLQFSLLGPKCCFSGIRRLVFGSNLDLPNLRTFYSQAGDMPLELHCPKLVEFFVYSELTISESTDEKTKFCVQNLRLLHVQKLTYPRDFKFSNLEILYFNIPSFILLSDFPRLKKIFYFEGVFYVDGVKDALENLLEQKRSLKMDQLRIYFDGYEINHETESMSLCGACSSQPPASGLE